MHGIDHFDLETNCIRTAGHAVPRKSPGEESAEDQEGLELPVNPDEGTPLIPDEQGVITVPT